MSNHANFEDSANMARGLARELYEVGLDFAEMGFEGHISVTCHIDPDHAVPHAAVFVGDPCGTYLTMRSYDKGETWAWGDA